MKTVLICLILLLAGAAYAQTGTAPSPAGNSPETAAMRSRLEAFGYSDIAGLERDAAGIWHAQATRGGAAVSVTIDKGGRITSRPR